MFKTEIKRHIIHEAFSDLPVSINCNLLYWNLYLSLDHSLCIRIIYQILCQIKFLKARETILVTLFFIVPQKEYAQYMSFFHVLIQFGVITFPYYPTHSVVVSTRFELIYDIIFEEQFLYPRGL